MSPVESGALIAFCGAAAFMLFGTFMYSMSFVERRRLRLEFDRLRRLKRAQRQLEKRATEAWDRLYDEYERQNAAMRERHEKFWLTFAEAYGKATGHTFPKPPAELFGPKVPPRGSA